MKSDLQVVADLLSQGMKGVSKQQFFSVNQIAGLLGWTKPVALRRLSALLENGVVLQHCYVREGRRGPEAIAYAVVGQRRQKKSS